MFLKLILVVFYLHVITVCRPFSVHKLGVPKLKISYVENCLSENNQFIILDYVLNNVDSDGRKALDLYMEVKKPLDTNNVQCNISIDKLTHGDWQPDIFNDKGTMCDIFKKFGKKAIERLDNEMIPKIKELCYVEKGNYKIEGFEVDQRNDITIPPLLGTFRVRVDAYSSNKEHILCVLVMADFH